MERPSPFFFDELDRHFPSLGFLGNQPRKGPIPSPMYFITSRDRVLSAKLNSQNITPPMATQNPLDSAPNTPANVMAKLADAERSIRSIRQARDTVVAHSHELAAKLAAAEERIAELSEECELARRSSEHPGQNRIEESSPKAELARPNIVKLDRPKLTLVDLDDRTTAELEDAYRQIVGLSEERDRLREELETERARNLANEEALVRLNEAEARLVEMEKAVERFKAQQNKRVAELGEQAAAATRTRDAAVGNVVKIQSQVKALKDEIEAMRRQSREERLMLEAQIMALQSQPEGMLADENELADEESQTGDPANASIQIEIVPPSPKPFAFGEAVTVAAALAADLDYLIREQSNRGLLENLDADLHKCDERAIASGLSAFHRGSRSCAEVTQWLCKTPAKVHATLPCLSETIAVLADLAALGPDVEAAMDASGVMIYAVDDDVDNCECLVMASEKHGFQANYSVKPEVALAQLKNLAADLIILDVDMPQMDGFEVYEQLRKMPHHKDTPVLFLSGLISAKERLEELPPGNYTFLAKPYNLAVLFAKVTTMILRSRLAALGAGVSGMASAA